VGELVEDVDAWETVMARDLGEFAQKNPSTSGLVTPIQKKMNNLTVKETL